jgi:hypothetical protein
VAGILAPKDETNTGHRDRKANPELATAFGQRRIVLVIRLSFDLQFAGRDIPAPGVFGSFPLSSEYHLELRVPKGPLRPLVIVFWGKNPYPVSYFGCEDEVMVTWEIRLWLRAGF